MEYYKNLDLEDIIYINDKGIVCWEQWGDVPDYEGTYQVSNLGRVRSLTRTILVRNRYLITCKGRVFKLRTDNHGYIQVKLSKNGNSSNKSVHQLVAIVFLSHIVCGHKWVVNHKNFIKTDNHLENLEIITQRENANHKHLKSSSSFVGVDWHKKANRWRARIHVNGKVENLGLFDTEEEASQYYENALVAIENGEDIIIKRKEHASKYKWVSWMNRDKKWQVIMKIEKDKIYLGRFDSEEDAYQAILNYNKNLSNI